MTERGSIVEATHHSAGSGTTRCRCTRLALGCLVVVMLIAPVAGCGSGGAVTQAEMRRRAIRRSSGDDDQANAKTNAIQDKQAAVDDALESGDSASTGQAEPVPATPAARAGTVDQDPGSSAPSGQADPAPDVLSTGLPPAPAVQPAEPLTLVERRQRTIDNLTRIAAAVQQYFAKNGRLFLPAISDQRGRSLLSWRVELLPYLGYQQLYEQFHLDEPWDSPHNKPLLAAIPDVYQSPERFDEKTNYVAPIATFTPYSRPHGFATTNFEDGLDHTVVLLEADDVAAVNWTEPADLPLKLERFSAMVGNLREDGFFVIWADGTLSRIGADCAPGILKAMFTYDGGENFSSYTVRQSATAEPEMPEATGEPALVERTDREPAEPSAEPSMQVSGRTARSRATATEGGRTGTPAVRFPVPNAHSLAEAKKLIREIYHREYEGSKAPRERQALAKRMLQQAESVQPDPAGCYVLLDIAAQISTEIGDTATAAQALDRIVAAYEVDDVDLWNESLAKLAKRDRSDAGVRILLEKSQGLVERAMERDAFDMAENLCAIALGAARQLRERETVQRLDEQQKRIDTARRAHRDVQRTIAELNDQDDPQANLEVGKYYSLVKGEWEKGLPLLAKGDDGRFRELAEAELRQPTIPQDQLDIADGWWELSDKHAVHRKSLRLRAAKWYAQALTNLPPGLWRAKAELRLDEMKKEFGAETVEAVTKAAASAS